MKKRNILLVSLLLIALVGIGYVFFRLKKSDTSLTEAVVPKLELASIVLTELTESHAKMLVHARIDNPTPIGIFIDSIAYAIYVQGEEIIQSSYNTPIDLNADTTSKISAPLTIQYKQIKSIGEVMKQQGKDSALYKIHATIYSKALPGKSMKIETEKLLPFFLIPEVEIEDVSIGNLTSSKAFITITTTIKNDNAFSINFKNMSYKIQLEEHNPMEGSISKPIRLGKKDSTELTIPVHVTFKELTASLGDLIRKGEKLRYKVTMNTQLESDTYLLKGSSMHITASGDLKQLKEAAEK